VVLLDRSGTAGHGVAYRDQPDCHLLNVRAGAMSAFPDRPGHFLDWLNGSHGPRQPIGAGEFLPRRVYGLYLESLLAGAQKAARPGVSLEFHGAEVLELCRGADGARLRLGGETQLHADQVVLALGNPGPADPPLADPAFYASPRYLGYAWAAQGLHAVERDEDLLLVGSGLTALDWLASLQALGHRGRVFLLSRRGQLPREHRAAAAWTLSFDPLELPPRLRALLRRLRAELAAAEAAGTGWRAVLDALRPSTAALWQRLPPAEQSRFLRHLRPYWEIHRHRAAPGIVAGVQALQESGRLQLLAGRLLVLEERDGAVDASLRLRRGGTLRLRVQRVVNCTGPESNYRRLNHPLVASLRERGLIQPDVLGLGLLCDAEGALLDQDGQASGWLHALGPLRKGQLWETTAVPEIRVQAQALALHLLQLEGVERDHARAEAGGVRGSV
jgi:uncharacterized NAD(P)/FAD-binding protein YdhS